MDVLGQLEEVEQGRLGQTNLTLKSGCLVCIVHLLWGRLAFMVRFIYLFICIDDRLKQWRQSFSRDSKVCLTSVMFQYHSYRLLSFFFLWILFLVPVMLKFLPINLQHT